MSLASEDIRQHNLAAVTHHLVTHGPSSRSQVSAGTGLTRGAITGLVRALTTAGILRESRRLPTTGTGRPGTLLEFAADDIALLAVQLDADRATALATDLAGNVLFRLAKLHGRPMGDPRPVLDVLATVLDDALECLRSLQRRHVDTTIVTLAPVGEEPPVVLADTDLGWGRVDVLTGLRERLPHRVGTSGSLDTTRLLPDTPIAALAEMRMFEDARNAVYIKSNSGIGGALIVDGRIVSGAHGFAGLVGHIPIVPDGAQCECGQYGCLTTVAGPDVILARAGMSDLVAREGLTVALDELVRRVHSGETRASGAWDAALPWIAQTLQLLARSLDPSTIIVGGFWARLSDSIAREFASNGPTILLEGVGSGPDVTPSRLGEDAALLGAVWAARDRLLADPLQIRT